MSIQFSQYEECYADITLTYSTIVEWSQVLPFFRRRYKTCRRYIIRELSSPDDLTFTSKRHVVREDHNFLMKDTREKKRSIPHLELIQIWSQRTDATDLVVIESGCAKSLAKEYFYAREQTDFSNISSLYMSSPTQFSSLKRVSSRTRRGNFFFFFIFTIELRCTWHILVKQYIHLQSKLFYIAQFAI